MKNFTFEILEYAVEATEFTSKGFERQWRVTVDGDFFANVIEFEDEGEPNEYLAFNRFAERNEYDNDVESGVKRAIASLMVVLF